MEKEKIVEKQKINYEELYQTCLIAQLLIENFPDMRIEEEDGVKNIVCDGGTLFTIYDDTNTCKPYATAQILIRFKSIINNISLLLAHESQEKLGNKIITI